MSPLSIWQEALWHCARTIYRVLLDLAELLRLATKSRSALAAQNLFLRKQLALFQERSVRPHHADDSARWLMARLSRMFDWRDALVVVKPDTLIRQHRRGFRLFWRWKSKPAGRPALSKDLQELIRKMAAENPTWGEEHIANELKLKLGIRVSPRTVQKYLASYHGRVGEFGPVNIDRVFVPPGNLHGAVEVLQLHTAPGGERAAKVEILPVTAEAAVEVPIIAACKNESQ